MGNYVFTTDALLEALRADAEDEDSVHDMGGSIMPMLADAGEAWVYDFSTNIVPGASERDHGYWRDVGTIDAYYDAHMDLVSVTPVFNLYNDRWPIYTLPPKLPPAKFVLGGRAEESMVSAGAIIGGGSVHNSVVSPGVRVERGARVEDSVLMDGVHIGEGAYVRRAILDKNVVVPPWARIGVDTAADKQHYHVSEGGVTVLGKGARASCEDSPVSTQRGTSEGGRAGGRTDARLSLWSSPCCWTTRRSERFDRLRAEHFPPERNHLAAHVTLFHALPGEHLDERPGGPARRRPTGSRSTSTVTGLRFLGCGVAYTLGSAELADAARRAGRGMASRG